MYPEKEREEFLTWLKRKKRKSRRENEYYLHLVLVCTRLVLYINFFFFSFSPFFDKLGLFTSNIYGSFSANLSLAFLTPARAERRMKVKNKLEMEMMRMRMRRRRRRRRVRRVRRISEGNQFEFDRDPSEGTSCRKVVLRF